MPRYTVTNHSGTALVGPYPFNQRFRQGETKLITAPAAEADNPYITAAIQKGLISVSTEDDPLTPDDIEVPVGGTATGGSSTDGDSTYLTPGAYVRYFSAAGNDETGDGSAGAPWRQMQRLIDDIPRMTPPHGAVTFTLRLVGAGPFEMFDPSRVPAGVNIAVIEDAPALLATISPGSSWSRVTGATARTSATVAGFPGLASNGLAYSTYPAFGGITASAGPVPLASAAGSASFDSPNAVDPTFGAFDLEVYSYTATVDFGTNKQYLAPFAEDLANFSRDRIRLIGLNCVGNTIDTANILFSACTTSIDFQGDHQNIAFQSGTILGHPSSTRRFNVGGSALRPANITNSFIGARLVIFGTVAWSGCVIDSPGGAMVELGAGPAAGALQMANIDFEGPGAAIICTGPGNIIQSGSVFCDAIGSFITPSGGADLLFRYAVNSGSQIRGSTTGNGIVLSRGAVAVGVRVAANGNLTCGGSEIVVGGLAGTTFASLPLTDFTGASAQMVMAS